MNTWQRIMLRKHMAYRQCFLDDKGELTPAAKVVFADLAKFAALTGPTWVSPVMKQSDVPATFQRIGRADVIHRCWQFMRLSVNKLYEAANTPESEE